MTVTGPRKLYIQQTSAPHDYAAVYYGRRRLMGRSDIRDAADLEAEYMADWMVPRGKRFAISDAQPGLWRYASRTR